MSRKPIESWLKAQSWNLIITAIGAIMALTIANQKINAMEKKIDQYPSYDYFQLKFDTIEKSLSEVKVKLDEHIRTK
jgi:hypothetical protein